MRSSLYARFLAEVQRWLGTFGEAQRRRLVRFGERNEFTRYYHEALPASQASNLDGISYVCTPFSIHVHKVERIDHSNPGQVQVERMMIYGRKPFRGRVYPSLTCIAETLSHPSYLSRKLHPFSIKSC